MEHSQILPTQAELQDAPVHASPKPEEASRCREGKDKEMDAVHQTLLDLSSGEEDPADHPSPMFERLKHDLMKAIKPYNLNDKHFTYNLDEKDLQIRHSFRNFFQAGGPEMFFDLADEVYAHVHGGDVPETFVDYKMRGDIIESERVRVIRRGRQARMGKEKEKEDSKLSSIWEETDDDVAEAEKTGFLPVNSDLLDIRNEALFPK
ncbi:MAG: hypothetical protein Q9215_000203 [Flavoplaca cf. flavocitrina]